jgi:hypothetical protein
MEHGINTGRIVRPFSLRVAPAAAFLEQALSMPKSIAPGAHVNHS